MQAVITGDIINSQKSDVKIWHSALQSAIGENFNDPARWEIYRGDEFQYYVEDSKDAFLEILKIKSSIKKIKNLDVRISIGIGNRDSLTERISISGGSAFVNSGRNFEGLKKDKINLRLCSGNPDVDNDLNLMFKWALVTMDNWSTAVAETVFELLMNENLTQEILAKKLNISQSSVSQRMTRANYDLILETDKYYKEVISSL